MDRMVVYHCYHIYLRGLFLRHEHEDTGQELPRFSWLLEYGDLGDLCGQAHDMGHSFDYFTDRTCDVLTAQIRPSRSHQTVERSHTSYRSFLGDLRYRGRVEEF